MVQKIQFITHSDNPNIQLEQIEKACKSGIKWIQLRIKTHSKEVIKELAQKARDITKKHNVSLCINDHLDIALQVKSDACHLGKNDMPIASAKALTQGKIIIGSTCNTIEDVYTAYKAGADYIGLGPYHFTTTKQNLSSTLGLEGYNTILKQMQSKNITIPVIAIGGIDVKDVKALIESGVYGIALSGAIINAKNWEEKINLFQNEITTYKKKINVANS